jgi:hypothetical protein
MNCPECESEISETARRCRHCGSALRMNTSTRKFLIAHILIGGVVLCATLYHRRERALEQTFGTTE